MASSPSGWDLDISQVASEMGITITNTVDLIQTIRAGQSPLSPTEDRVDEKVGWGLPKFLSS